QPGAGCAWRSNIFAVAALSVASQVALSYQVLKQKPPHPRSQQRSIIHAAPHMRIAQSAGWPRAAVPVSWSDSAGWPRYGYGRDKLPVAGAAVARLLPGDTRKSSDVWRRRGAGHAIAVDNDRHPAATRRREFAVGERHSPPYTAPAGLQCGSGTVLRSLRRSAPWHAKPHRSPGH